MSDSVRQYVNVERDPAREPDTRITGLMIQYYHVCRRELWFMSRDIDINRETTNIQRGTHIDKTSYKDSRKSFQIDSRIQIDLLDSGDLMEVKASSALEQPARMQLLFYLWYLREIHDVEKDGVLAYPTERTRERVELNSKTVAQVEETIEGILDTVAADTPPKLEKKAYCDSCLYQDICWM